MELELKGLTIKQIIEVVNSFLKKEIFFDPKFQKQIEEKIKAYLSDCDLKNNQKLQLYILLFNVFISSYNFQKTMAYYNLIKNLKPSKATLFKLDYQIANLFFNLQLYNNSKNYFENLLTNPHFNKVNTLQKCKIILNLVANYLFLNQDFNLTFSDETLNNLISNLKIYFKILKNKNSNKIAQLIKEYENFIKDNNNQLIVNHSEINLPIISLLIENNCLITAENLLKNYLENNNLSVFTKIKLQSLLFNIYKVNNLPNFISLLSEHEKTKQLIENINHLIIQNYINLSEDYFEIQNKLFEKENNLKKDCLTQCLTRDSLNDIGFDFVNGYGAVIFFDLNNLKTINDTMGHFAGDTYLIHFANILLKFSDYNVKVFRLGGDEFLIVANNYCCDKVNKLLNDIIKLAQKPIKILNKKFAIGFSAGISMYPKNATEISKLIKLADSAMYKSKQNKENELITISYC